MIERGPARALRIVLALSFLAAGSPGCDDEDGALEPAPVEIAGAWEQVSGPLLIDSGRDIAELGLSVFLRFDRGATGAEHRKRIATGMIFCRSFIYGVLAPGTLIIDDASRLQVFGVSRPDATSLIVTDVQGREAVWRAILAIPDSVLCRDLPVVWRFDLPVDLEVNSGLAFDGARLWFTGIWSQNLVSVDPETGDTGTPRNLVHSGTPYVHGSQGADLWCVGGSKASRIAPDEVLVDEVEVRDFGLQRPVRSAAFRAVTQSLWLWAGASDAGLLLEIDAQSEPDLLVRTMDFRESVGAMTWRGSELIAVVNQSVAVLDGDPLRVARIYELADGLAPRGVAAVGERIYVLSSPGLGSSQAVILETSL